MTGTFQLGRHRIVAILGIVIAAIMFLLASARVSAGKITYLRITYPAPPRWSISRCRRLSRSA